MNTLCDSILCHVVGGGGDGPSEKLFVMMLSKVLDIALCFYKVLKLTRFEPMVFELSVEPRKLYVLNFKMLLISLYYLYVKT